jgi:hypothetical protein
LTGNFEWETRFRAPLSQRDAPVFFDAGASNAGVPPYSFGTAVTIPPFAARRR